MHGLLLPDIICSSLKTLLMRTRLFVLTILFSFCYALLQAQTPSGAVPAQAPAPEKKGIAKTENSHSTYYYESNGYGHANGHNPCKVFIGVGTSPESGGLKVDYTKDNTPASTYGVQVGDIILALDNAAVSSYDELVRERDKHQPGDAFTLNILRSGSKMNIDARFKACSQDELEKIRQQEEYLRPILGVFEAEEVDQDQGLVIGEIISGKGAAVAGLQPGDVIIQVDGKAINGTNTLRTTLAGHKPGDPVAVVYTRNSQQLQTKVVLSGDHQAYSYRQAYSYKTERDPCAVFIGVYTADAGADGQGVRVTGIIEGTPAKLSNLQLGDVILALDDQPINNYPELRRERDKHQPGDNFRMKVLREGAMLNINATFKACPKPGSLATPVPEVVEAAPIQQPDQTLANPETTLQVALDLYPNPTADVLTVRFEAEAVPTTVRIADATGKTIYSNVLNRFGGFFNEQISLYGQAPGIFTLTVQQGKKIITRNVVLVTRT